MPDTRAISGRLDSTVWLGVGLVGVLVFVLGIYRPALGNVPYAAILEIVLAVAGACLAVLGFSFAMDQREAERKRPPRRPRRVTGELTQEFGPSFEVYDPHTAEESPTPPEPRTP